MPITPSPQPRRTALKRSRAASRKLEHDREGWLAEIAPDSLFHCLFDELPGVFFFAKDRAGRTMAASRRTLDQYHMHDISEMIGLTDFDLNPHTMAEGYVRDDQRLLSGKAKRIERLELWFDPQGMPDWFMVTKLPILNRRKRPIGVMGVLRRAAEHEMKLPIMQAVSQAAMMLRRDYAKSVSLVELASACGQSLRNLQRRFQSAFGVTPQEFLIKTRVLAAMRLLEETRLSAAEIATRCGFVDASSFAEQFKRRAGTSPSEYRTRHRHS